MTTKRVSLLALRKPSPAIVAVTGTAVPFPVYLTGISRNGRHVHWSYNAAKAKQLPRDKWTALRDRFPEQLKGRLVRVQA